KVMCSGEKSLMDVPGGGNRPSLTRPLPSSTRPAFHRTCGQVWEKSVDGCRGASAGGAVNSFGQFLTRARGSVVVRPADARLGRRGGCRCRLRGDGRPDLQRVHGGGDVVHAQDARTVF